MASDTQPRPRRLVPGSVKACQTLLRKHGFRGMEIDQIEPDRVYVLTKPVYHREGEGDEGLWLQDALTIFFECDESGDLQAHCVQGWQV